MEIVATVLFNTNEIAIIRKASSTMLLAKDRLGSIRYEAICAAIEVILQHGHNARLDQLQLASQGFETLQCSLANMGTWTANEWTHLTGIVALLVSPDKFAKEMASNAKYHRDCTLKALRLLEIAMNAINGIALTHAQINTSQIVEEQ